MHDVGVIARSGSSFPVWQCGRGTFNLMGKNPCSCCGEYRPCNQSIGWAICGVRPTRLYAGGIRCANHLGSLPQHQLASENRSFARTARGNEWASDFDDARNETPLILIPATPLDVLDAIPGYLVVGEPPPAVPMSVWKFTNVAKEAGAETTITYARAIVPPHLIKKTKVLESAYLIDSFAVRFRRPESPRGTFPYRPGVVGYAMWERKQRGSPPHGFSSVGAGYRNAHTQGQFPGLTELSRLLKEGLL